MRNPWKVSTVVLLGGLGLILTVRTARDAEAGAQPHLWSGIDKLNDARKEIGKVAKGSHKKKAAERIDEAIAELKAAIEEKEEDAENAAGGGDPEKLVAGRWGVTLAKVRDAQTGLVWQRDVPEREMNAADAKSHCNQLALEGGGWRLPTKDELLGIVVKGSPPTIDASAFPGTPKSDFWTSTFQKGGAFQSTVDFFTGSDSVAPPTITHWVRCVRAK